MYSTKYGRNAVPLYESKYSRDLKKKKLLKQQKELNKERELNKKNSVSSSNIDNRSTKDTFLEWLDKCGNDLCVYEYSRNNIILSCAGSDGPTIHNDNIDKVPFNKPEAIDKYLEDEGLYEPFESEFVTYNNPSKVRYVDWFNRKYRK